MDRYDEKNDRTDEVGESESPRKGDILGLSDVAVPKEPGDPSTEYDAESVAKRRARATEEEPATHQENPSRQGGATGVDLGAGGQGTLVGRE